MNDNKRLEIRRQFNPVSMGGCVLHLPFYKYGKEATNIWDQSGQGNHGVITGATPASYAMTNGVELVSNGGMEAGTPPTGWINGGMTTFERSNAQKHSGSFSLHLGCATEFANGYMYLNKVAGKTYKISFWYYIVDAPMQGTVQNGNATADLASWNISTPTGSWQYFEQTFVETVTGTSGAIQFYTSFGFPSEFYIDDVSIQEVIGYESIGWSFDGVDDKVLLTEYAPMMGNFSLMCWYKADVQASNGYIVGNHSTASPARSGYGITTLATNKVQLFIGDGTNFNWTETPPSAIDNIWHNVSMSVDRSGNVNYYVDSATVYSSACALTGNVQASTTTLAVGVEWISPTIYNPFRGSVGEVLIFNRALSPQEIKGYYERTRHIYGV